MVAHELGHAFSLEHDFRDGAYIMSYGLGMDRLSACHAEFLVVHPYFNASIPQESSRWPIIDFISPTEYTAGSKSVPVQLTVHDEEELHQVILKVRTREPSSAAGNFEVKACRALPDRYDYDAVVEFEYDGVIPSDNLSSLWNPDRHPIFITAVDYKGNVVTRHFELICGNCPLMLVKNSGDNQQGIPGALLANPLIIELQDKNGSMIEGALVTFSVTTGNGRFNGRSTVVSAMTDANGRAQSTLTLGPNPGTNTVEVSVAGLDPVTFNAMGVGTPTMPIMGSGQLPNGAIARLGIGRIGESDRAVAFSPDGQRFAVASALGVWLYDVTTSRELALLTGHTGVVETVAFSPDGTTLASGSHDNTVKLWDVATQTNIATLEGHIDVVTSVSYSSDGTTLASGSWYGTVKLWDVAARTNIATLKGSSPNVAFSPDGTILTSGQELWDVATRISVATLEGERFGFFRRVYAAAFSSDGTTLALASSRNEIRLWDVATQTTFAILGYSNEVHSLTFSPDGTTLASGSADRMVRLWDVATRTNIATFEVVARTVVFSPNGTILATAIHDVWLWDVAMRTFSSRFGNMGVNITSLTFSPDGTTLASGSADRMVRLWDVATQTKIVTLEGHRGWVNSVSFSLDGTTLASGSSDRTIKLWDVATRTDIATLEGHGGWVNSVSFSLDGTTLASGSSDRTIKLWDVATRTDIATLEGHGGRVNSVSFSLDGTTLASGSSDRTIKLWDVAMRTNIVTLEGHTWTVNSVSFSPDGKELASGSDDGTILLWDMSPYIKPQTPASAPIPDFDGDGTVGVSDFLLFVEQFGFNQGDEGYEARFDLDGDGVIGIGDFLIFVDNFGKKVS